MAQAAYAFSIHVSLLQLYGIHNGQFQNLYLLIAIYFMNAVE